MRTVLCWGDCKHCRAGQPHPETVEQSRKGPARRLLARLDAWLERRAFSRCTWQAPDGRVCIRKDGHRGLCTTDYLWNDGRRQWKTYRRWRGINWREGAL